MGLVNPKSRISTEKKDQGKDMDKITQSVKYFK
jgi:hypothetical protein